MAVFTREVATRRKREYQGPEFRSSQEELPGNTNPNGPPKTLVFT